MTNYEFSGYYKTIKWLPQQNLHISLKRGISNYLENTPSHGGIVLSLLPISLSKSRTTIK